MKRTFRPIHAVLGVAVLLAGYLLVDHFFGRSGARFERVGPDANGRVALDVGEPRPARDPLLPIPQSRQPGGALLRRRATSRARWWSPSTPPRTTSRAKRGFRADGAWMVNNKCDTATRLAEVNLGRSGCAPVPLRFRQEGSTLVLAENDVLEGWRYFRWADLGGRRASGRPGSVIGSSLSRGIRSRCAAAGVPAPGESGSMPSVELVLYQEEFQRLDQALKKLRQEANARAIFLIDKNGQQIAAAGEIEQFDTTSLASLTAGNVAATDGLAKLIGEREFSVLFHEGKRDHIHISIVGKRAILLVIFDERSLARPGPPARQEGEPRDGVDLRGHAAEGREGRGGGAAREPLLRDHGRRHRRPVLRVAPAEAWCPPHDLHQLR